MKRSFSIALGGARLEIPPLSGQQQRVYEAAVTRNESLFFTGCAGSGKSYTLGAIIAGLRAKHGENRVGVTSSTGISALAIGGTTLHSFAGIGLGNNTPAELFFRMRAYARRRWRRTRVLVLLQFLDDRFGINTQTLA
jgi:ATP-dependent DNA helicase PIF1